MRTCLTGLWRDKLYSHKVSIIVAVYNIEKYISKCLDSIIGQDYENLEIIVVDDCSQDRSGIICEDYAAKDKRIEVIHHKNNQRLPAVRNTGIDHAESFCRTISEGIITDRGNGIWDGNRGKTGAPIKGRIADRGYRIWDNNRRKARTVIECARTDGGNGAWNGNRGKAGAVLEGKTTDKCNGIGNGNRSQRITARESERFNSSNSIWNRNGS